MCIQVNAAIAIMQMSPISLNHEQECLFAYQNNYMYFLYEWQNLFLIGAEYNNKIALKVKKCCLGFIQSSALPLFFKEKERFGFSKLSW